MKHFSGIVDWVEIFLVEKKPLGCFFINLALDHDHGSEILVVKIVLPNLVYDSWIINC